MAKLTTVIELSIEKELVEIAMRYERGNTLLIDALMGMVNQYFDHAKDDPSIVSHSFMSCEEEAIDVLIDAGFAQAVGKASYRLLWDKLEERKNLTKDDDD